MDYLGPYDPSVFDQESYFGIERPCDECNNLPCLCADIESGKVCGKCHQELPQNERGDYYRCGDCEGGSSEC
jgi:hypothetical protein